MQQSFHSTLLNSVWRFKEVSVGFDWSTHAARFLFNHLPALSDGLGHPHVFSQVSRQCEPTQRKGGPAADNSTNHQA